MRLSIVFLGLLALVAATPLIPKYQAADQDLLKKQQHVLNLLHNIVDEDLSDEYLSTLGHKYDIEENLLNYDNPSVVKYYWFLWKTGHLQPMHTTFSLSLSHLRKEASLLSQVLVGAKDYDTFLQTAAWARVHVNQDLFVKAFSSAVLLRPDMHGVVLPAPYEVFPHYFFDTKILQEVNDHIHKHVLLESDVHHIWVNHSSHLPHDENKIAYFTEDIGLSTYYAYVTLAGYMVPHHGHSKNVNWQQGSDDLLHHKNGHGAHYYYIHHQLLARYNLERLSQGLEPIKELDYYWEHIETPYTPSLRHVNGAELPSRGEHIYVTPRHHKYELIKLIRKLERRIVDAIDSGHVITPQGAFLSLYQPHGYNILGELIEGTGRSINPRYYGSFAHVAIELLGNVPEFHNIWEYTPSALDLGFTCLRDPIFWQLHGKIQELFHYYSEALPAYQLNDVLVPGVHIDKVVMDDLHTYFSDYVVDPDNLMSHPVVHHKVEGHPAYPHVQLHLKRLDHKPYEFAIHVQSQKVVPGAVVRVFLGPKYNYDGQPIDYNEHRHYFYEIDQFVHDLVEGQNVIVRNSHQATGQSFDWPLADDIEKHVNEALHSQNPYYITEPQQLFGFPARLTIPKGTHEGFPMQLFVVITSGVHHQQEQYGPVVESEWQTYQPHHYQVVGTEEYQQYSRMPMDKLTGGYKTVDVLPSDDATLIFDGPWHWGYLYKKYPGSYQYPHWQQHWNVHGSHHHEEHHHDTEGHHDWEGQSHLNKWEHYQEGGEHLTHHHGVVEHHENPGLTGHLGHLKSGIVVGQGGYRHGLNEHHEHHEYLHQYYENKHISDIIGGVVSLDGKPLGYPFDRPLGHSVFYAHNLHVKDIYVYHHDEPITQH